VALQIDKIEDFALASRKQREEVPDVLRDALSVDACAGIRVVNAFNSRERGIGKPLPSLIQSLYMQRDIPGYAVNPAFHRGIPTILAELPMHQDKGLLSDFFGIVHVARKCQRPAKNLRLERTYKLSKCLRIARASDRGGGAQCPPAIDRDHIRRQRELSGN
jgi:hypothetical protein